MMKRIALVLTVSLASCFNDTRDLKAHITSVQANTTTHIAPMPAVTVFDHFDYSAQMSRSPFDVPKPEVMQEKIQQRSGCLNPDLSRKKQPLEKFSLSDLVMRGTLGELGVTWALVEASDKSLHRVAVGSYVGLYHGRITAVSQDKVTLLELVPDDTGCWVERETVVAMTETSVKEQER
ncbi:pilus assembly protein PilP [Cognaticolwellia mytili]|uniref:pilus assembly protein PilP n=1 Tax=Cognaticolwellia mytili TaxID=1888913 RepID=UPI000A172705|nr:pilus assembly protein PilP [Cognaticolwellia mytili]